MADMIINGDVVLKKNNATDAQGVAIPPTLSSLNYGEIAINYNANDACIFIKALGANNQEEIVKFVGESVIVRTLGEILGESAADLATLKEMLKLFEGSSSDVLTLVKNLQTEVALKADKTYVDGELAKKLGKTETAVDSSKLGGIAAADYWRNNNSGTTSYDWAVKNLTMNGSITDCKGVRSNTVHGYFIGDAASGIGAGNTGGLFYAYGNNPLLFYTNAGERMRITGDGKILIGTTREDAMLHLSSSTMNKYAAIFRNTNSTKDGSFGLVVDGGTSSVDRCARFRNHAGTDLMQITGTGDVLLGVASPDGVHRFVNFGSTKSTYYRFGSRKTGFANVGYIGCGSTENDTVYLNGSEVVTFGSGGRLNDIVINSSSSSYVDFNKGVQFKNKVVIGTINSGSSASPTYKDIDFQGAYGIYAQIRMPEISQSSGEGRLEFCVRGQKGTSTTAVPERVLSLYADQTARFYGNTIISNINSYRSYDNEGNQNRLLLMDSSNDLFMGGIDRSNRVIIRHKAIGVLTLSGNSPIDNTVQIVDGRVSIGNAIATPNNRLHVDGNVQVDEGVFFRKAVHGYSWNVGNGVVLTDITDNDQQTPLLTARRLNTPSTRLFSMELLNTGSELRFQFQNNCRFMFTSNGALAINKNGNRPTQALDVGGNGLFSGNLVVKGEGGSYTLTGLAAAVPASSVSRLSDLSDVDLTGASEGYVLYQSTDVNANGDRIWKAKTSEKTWDDIHGKPMAFRPLDHNHIGSTYVTTPSDRALKTDLIRIESATNTILSLTPYTYNWTAQAMEVFGFKSHSSAGVIAQEIENIIPSAVTPLNGEFMSVDYIQIIPYLIGAFHELHAALQSKNIANANATKEYKRMYGANEKLARRVSELESELTNIKNQIAA